MQSLGAIMHYILRALRANSVIRAGVEQRVAVAITGNEHVSIGRGTNQKRGGRL